MNTEINNEFDFDDWFGDLDMSTSSELTEEEWSDYIHIVTDEEFTEKDYLIGYWDMGMFEEKIVRASNEELAIDGFLQDYQPKRGLPPYIARCETIRWAEARVAAGYTDLPEDGQFERYQDFGSAYY
ncbi:hypothetical protein, partial [Undibacterium sp. 10I3]